MRDIEIIKEQRDKIKNDIIINEENMKEVTNMREWTDLKEHEKGICRQLIRVRSSMRTQVNTLNYVLNEDSEIDNYTENKEFVKAELSK